VTEEALVANFKRPEAKQLHMAEVYYCLNWGMVPTHFISCCLQPVMKVWILLWFPALRKRHLMSHLLVVSFTNLQRHLIADIRQNA